MIATALVLGSRFKLVDFRAMWLGVRSVSALSTFFSESKFSIYEMNLAYAGRVFELYSLREGGYFIIDDTMERHTKLCKMIYGVFWLFDHAMGTNLKAKCIVVLYYSDGFLIKFPIGNRLFIQEGGTKWPWRRKTTAVHRKKYELAIDLIEEALKRGYPKSTVLADAWFGMNPFVKELKRLKLDFVLEIKSNSVIKRRSSTLKRTPKGRIAKNQYEKISLAALFAEIDVVSEVGFPHDMAEGKKEKVLYHLKVTTTRSLNAFDGSYRLVQSIDPVKNTTKYLLSNNLNWEGVKIVSAYSERWVIEEFFRNAKQLTNMEGACLRSEQGVTLALCLVSWIDFLLHYENQKDRAVREFKKKPLTVQSIIRQQRLKNAAAFTRKIQEDEGFVSKWLDFVKTETNRDRKTHSELLEIERDDKKKAA